MKPNQVESNRKWRAKNAAHFKRQQLGYYYEKKYGISQADYDAMFVAQKGRCAICKKHQRDLKTRLAVDHCHTTNKVRKLLCSNCNSALGLVNEDIHIMKNMVKYIQQIKGVIT